MSSIILHHSDFTYGHGMFLTGMKKPLVNPATLEMTGDRRIALSGKEQMRAMRRAVQVWLRAMFTTTNWPNTRTLYDCTFTS